MNPEEIKKVILKALENSPKNADGWASFADIGYSLRKFNFDFKTAGFYKLSQFIGQHSDILEIKTDNSFDTPVPYGRIVIGNVATPSPVTAKKISSPQPPRQRSFSGNPKSALFEWAYCGDYRTTLEKLKKLALPEKWHYGTKETPNYYPILDNYLSYTFYRLTQEKGKIIENDEYAAFNTGLVDKRYEAIYALFKKQSRSTQGRVFWEFCIPGEEYSGKALVANFRPLPERASYFKSINDMLFDTTVGEPSLDYQHIIVENTDRLPLTFLQGNCPSGFTWKDPSKFEFQDKKKYFEDLGDAIEKDTRTNRYIKGRLNDSLILALKRVEWNFKTAIPVYFPTRNQMSLLLPLSLVDDEIVDIALVVEQTKSGSYLGHTILPLGWAYNNARLVCRPDSDWLVAERINQQEEELE